MSIRGVSERKSKRVSTETIGASLPATASKHPDSLALVSRHQGIRWTYAEMAEQVDRTARSLIACGATTGSRVGIWSPTCAEWTLIQYGTARIGAILVNINPAYRTEELTYALDKVGVSTLVAAESIKSTDYLAMISVARQKLPELRRVITTGSGNAGGASDITWAQFDALADQVEPGAVDAIAATLSSHDPVNIQFTSGTTGKPKGATLTHHNILNNAVSIASLLGYTPDDRVCIPVPLYHCFGMVIGNLACTATGAAMVYPEASFDPLATLQAVAAERCTSIYGVPTMFIAELEHPAFAEHDVTSLRTGVMAGAPCPVEVMKRVITDMHVPEVTIAYGMTETSPVSFLTRRSDDLERRVSTVGTVVPHVEAKVVNPETGASVPPGTVGEVCTRGYVVMAGYWNYPAATSGAVDAEGWMHTGDLGVVDRDEYLQIVGRIKDLVIRGGENIYPREVEEVLHQHDAIADAQVIGVPDERMGEELMAWIKLRPGAELTAEDVRTFCRERLAHFKVPRFVKFVEDFPVTVTGKVQKFRMREIAIAELASAMS